MSAPNVIAPQVGFTGQGAASVVVPPNLRGPGGGAPATLSRMLDIPLPDLFPIPDAHEFNIEADVSSVAVENNITITGLTVDIPQGYLAIVRGVSIYISNMLATTNVLYTVLTQGPGTAPAGYQNLRMFPRVAPFVGNTFDSMIRLVGPKTLTMIYSNLDGGTYQIGGAFSGWLWNVASDTRWKNAGEGG